MGPPTPTLALLLVFAEKALEQRKKTAEKLLEDSGVTLEKLNKLGFL